MRSVTCLLLMAALFGSGCATLTGTRRALFGAGVGAAAGAFGGTAFSPNEPSRSLNALVFGLGGALLGGGLAILTDTRPESSVNSGDLKALDRSTERTVREFQLLPNQELPDFLRTRIQPLIVEEYVEADSVAEDGALHEPHKVYRIKRQGELFARPVPERKGVQQ